MSAVDVLAVMDSEIIRNIERGAAKGSRVIRDLREARAVVAELIDAAEGFRGVTSGDDAGKAGMIACARLDAAISRIYGGES